MLSRKAIQSVGLSVLVVLSCTAVFAGCGGSGSTTTASQPTVSLKEACGDEQGQATYPACVAGYEAAAAKGGEAPEPPGEPQELTPEEASAAGDAEVAEQAEVNYDETATIFVHNGEGYEGILEIERAPIEPGRPGRINGSLAEGTTCEIDPQHDAVEPITLTTTNTTKRFSSSPGLALRAQTAHWERPGMHVEVGYTSGPECVEMTGDASQGSENGGIVGLSPSEPLQSNNSTSAQGFIVLDNYYSPAHPNGNPGKYANAVLVLEPEIGGEYFTVASAEGFLIPKGDGAVQDSAVHDAWPVIPGGNGGCLVQPPCEAAFKTE